MPPASTSDACVRFASSSSLAISTSRVTPPASPVRSLQAKVVLNALTTRASSI
jgi:hypothetical protein